MHHGEGIYIDIHIQTTYLDLVEMGGEDMEVAEEILVYFNECLTALEEAFGVLVECMQGSE